MSDIVERLRLREPPIPLMREAADEIERLRALVRDMLENDPNDMAADGVTVLDVWRKEARRALEKK